ncbi:MAG: hypothetical protein HN904_02955 [Victivallales bacterium]|nr:hypothetical protein [Victivallales bacterium]
MNVQSRAVGSRVLAACAALVFAVVLVGCQTAGQLVETAGTPQCPMCKTETKTTAIKGLNYTKSACPGCKTVRQTGVFDELADLTEVHVCDHCKAVVATCPACAKK